MILYGSLLQFSFMISMETEGANANWQQHKSGFIGLIEQKGMTFDNDFGYSFPLFSSFLKTEGREK